MRDDFFDRHWGKEPTVIRGVQPILSDAESFRLIQTASQAWRDKRDVLIRFFIGNANLVSQVGAHLPQSNDASYEDYVARLQPRLKGERFGIVVNEAQSWDWALADRLRAFARPLVAKIGLPTLPSHAVLFTGDYEATPFGVHKDRAHVFSFVVRGRKRMRVWPFDVFAAHADKGPNNPIVDLPDYSRFNDRSRLLEGEPGDILYWPASHWHVGESAGGLATSLSLSITDDPRQWTRTVSQLAAQLVTERIEANQSLNGLDESLKDKIQRYSMELASADGFRLSIPEPTRSLERTDFIECLYPVSSFQAAQTLICFCNGGSFEVAADASVLALVDELKPGLQASVARLASSDSRFELLAHCHRLGAFRVVERV